MKWLILLCICFLPLSTSVYADQKQKIVFVHGAWGGGWDYRNLERMLEEKGHYVHRITLTGQGERSHLISRDINLDTHIMDVINVIDFDELSNVTLVGHSYGGMVITGVVDRIPERIKHLVYVDAFVPLDGEAAIDFYPQERKQEFLRLATNKGNGISIPPFWPNWQESKDVPHPLGTYLQPITLNHKKPPAIDTTYILTIDQGASEDRFSRFAQRAKEFGWQYREWITGHNAQRSVPGKYVAFLDSLSH